ncbi:unnamed protein product [Lota lota]
MASVDVAYDKFHFRHDPKWTGRLGPQDGGGVMLCVACVIEMMESKEISSVRKCVALSGISGALICSPGALGALLQQDHRVCLHFTASLLGMLRTMKDPAALDQVIQVLVQLLLELKSDRYVQHILEDIQTQLCDHQCGRSLLPTFTFLGKMVEALPDLAVLLLAQYVPFLEGLCSALLHPDPGLKASLFYLWHVLLGGTSPAAMAPALTPPPALLDRLCSTLLQTLTDACTPELTLNCLGLLKQLVQSRESVSCLMNSQAAPPGPGFEQNLSSSRDTQDPETEPSPEHRLLPLILKKLLLSGDELLQVASAQCMVAVLVHSPSQYCAPFILADLPEFLFERVSSTRSEVLLWSLYNCLLLLCKDPLFYSHCHSVYGIEALVRSLKEALRLTNLEVQTQGLLLLTEILDRQPGGMRLFPSGPGFEAVCEAVVSGVSSPCLLVARQAASAGSSLLRLHHQSSPVQFRSIEKLIEAVSDRCTDLPVACQPRSTWSVKSGDPSSRASWSGAFLLQALMCVQAACRLAEQCVSDPLLKENVFMAPTNQNAAGDSLQSMCVCLLRYCDTVCIPTVTRVCERAPNIQMLQSFYLILSSQFTLLTPAMSPIMHLFASKLASSGFYRLALEHKALLCVGNRNPALEESCCGFILKLSMCLLSQSVQASRHTDLEELEAVLLRGLPRLCCRVSEWPLLLAEAPDHPDTTGAWAPQHCLLIILMLAMEHGDRLLPDPSVFSGVLSLLRSLQEQGDRPLPHPLLRCALYLLAATHNHGPPLDQALLSVVIKALPSCDSFSSVYTHHPPLLRFIYRYPELAQRLGRRVLELWLTPQTTQPRPLAQTKQPPAQTLEPPPTAGKVEEGPGEEVMEVMEQQSDMETRELQSLMKDQPAVVLTLLDMVCTSEVLLAERAVGVLEVLLRDRGRCGEALSGLLRPALLQALQRASLEDQHMTTTPSVDSLPLVLRLLCVVQDAASSSDGDVDGLQFKLLYRVSNLVGRVKTTSSDSLLPALNYLYCNLTLCPTHLADRAVSMLLSNTGLIEQLQTVISSSSSFSLSTSPRSALMCCSRLLLSSLVTLQHLHSSQVHKRIIWRLESPIQQLVFQKRNTDTLLLASSLRLLQSLLEVDLRSSLVCVTTGPWLTGPRPLEASDSSLYPLGARGARSLATALYGLVLQKQDMLLRASVNCLRALLDFLQRHCPTTAQYVVQQPWNRLLVYSLLSSGERVLLHPASLTLLSLLLQQGGRAIVGGAEVGQVMKVLEGQSFMELGQEAEHTLHLLLTQVHTHLHVCTVLLAVVLVARAFGSDPSRSPPHKHDNNLEIYKRLFETKRKEQLNALKNLVELSDVNQQYKIIDIMLKGLFKVLEDSKAVLVAANMQPEDPFPLDDKIKEAYSHIVENTAFFGDVALRFPRIVHHYYDRNADWSGLLRWGLRFCNHTGVFTGGTHQHVLTLMSQELGITEKTPDFINPYRTERDNVLHTAEAFQRLLREEEKRRRKEEKRKEMRKGPRISRSEL